MNWNNLWNDKIFVNYFYIIHAIYYVYYILSDLKIYHLSALYKIAPSPLIFCTNINNLRCWNITSIGNAKDQSLVSRESINHLPRKIKKIMEVSFNFFVLILLNKVIALYFCNKKNSFYTLETLFLFP